VAGIKIRKNDIYNFTLIKFLQKFEFLDKVGHWSIDAKLLTNQIRSSKSLAEESWSSVLPRLCFSTYKYVFIFICVSMFLLLKSAIIYVFHSSQLILIFLFFYSFLLLKLLLSGNDV